MGLMKITGMTQRTATEERRILTGAPSLSIYSDYRARLKYFSLAFLGITGLTDPLLVAKVAQTANLFDKAEGEPWSREEGERIVAAVGNPPPPSHVLATRIEGRATLVLRKVTAGTPGARKVAYSAKSGQSSFSLWRLLKDEGISIPEGMCLDVPVQLGEDEGALVVVADLRRKALRPTNDGAGPS